MVTFRETDAGDLPTLHRWLNEPGIVAWWEGDDVSWDGVVRDYGPDRDDGTEHFIAVEDGVDVGWIQCEAIGDALDEAAAWIEAGVDPAGGSIDYFVADPGRRGSGLGTRMIRDFLAEVVWSRHPEWPVVAVGPYVANEASWKALRAAGFTHLADVEDPDGPCRLMVLPRGQRGGS